MRVVTVVCRMLTKKSSVFRVKRVISSVTAPDDTNFRDATGVMLNFQFGITTPTGSIVHVTLLKPMHMCCTHWDTRNSSGDEIANVNFLYDDIVHALRIK